MRRKDNLSKSVRRMDPRFDRLGSGFGDAIVASLFGGGGRASANAAASASASSTTKNVTGGKQIPKNEPSAATSSTRTTFTTVLTPSVASKFKVTKKLIHSEREREREQSLLRKNFLSSHCANEKRRREHVKQHMDILRRTCVESAESEEEKPYLQSCTTVRLIEAATAMIEQMIIQEQAYILEKEALEQKQCLLKGQLELHREREREDDLVKYEPDEETLDVNDIRLDPFSPEDEEDTHLPRVDVCSAYGPDHLSFPVKEEMFFDNLKHNNSNKTGENSNHCNTDSTNSSWDHSLDNLDSSIFASVIKIHDFQKFLEDTNEFNVHEKMEYLDGCEYIAFEVEV